MILTRDGEEIVAIYMQNGDEVDEVKDANGRLVYTNTREITGTLPLSFTSRGKPLTDYRISGNTIQDGTPTPDAPVDVVGCGELEENVAIINSRSDTITNWYYTDVRLSNELPAGTYTISFTMDSKTGNANLSSLGRGNRTAYQSDVAQYQITNVPANINRTVTLNSNACIWARFLRSATPTTFSYNVSKIAIVSGNKPYGYKLPISSSGVNLFNITAFVQGIVPNRCTTSYDSTTNTLTINTTGADAHTGNGNPYHISVTGGETYTLSWDTSGVIGYVYIFENGLTDSSHLHVENSAYRNMSITMRSDTTFIIVRIGCDISNAVKTYSNIMLNLGATALPYEPYVEPTETNIYLGEAQTTRRIKKLVLTGTENMTDIVEYYNCGVSISSIAWSTVRSTTGGFTVSNNGRGLWASKSYFSGFETATDFKSYLAQQYQNGTPVTIWYILANPETGIVNEPLMKIGDYADTITMGQAGATIPTIRGTNVLDMASTVKPSEVYIKGKGIRAIT